MATDDDPTEIQLKFPCRNQIFTLYSSVCVENGRDFGSKITKIAMNM